MKANIRPAAKPSLRQLAIFDAVAQARSTGRAAANVGLSQPAVSHAIGKLEEMFATALFERGQHGSIPTATGSMLHRRVVRLREQIGGGIGSICSVPIESDAVRQRLASLSSAQVSTHLAIATHGSFRAAARQLAISEPAVQRTARDLERMIGMPLYARRSQQIAVTPAGETLAASFQRGLVEIEQAHDEIVASQGLSAGRIALACLPFMPKSILATALGQLLSDYPTVRVSLEEGAYDRLSADLKRGRIDMLIGALRNDDPSPELTTVPLFDDPYVIVARSGHPLSKRMQPGMLVDQGWVAPPLGTPRRAALEAFFSTLPHRPAIVLETASVTMTVETLMESDCLSLSCRSQIQTDFAPAKLAIVDLPVVTEPRRVGVTLRNDWLPTPVQEALLELLRRGVGYPLER